MLVSRLSMRGTYDLGRAPLSTLKYALHDEDGVVSPGRLDLVHVLLQFPGVIADLVAAYASEFEQGYSYRRRERLGQVLITVVLDDNVEFGLHRKSRTAKRVRAWLQTARGKTEFFLHASHLGQVDVVEMEPSARFQLRCGTLSFCFCCFGTHNRPSPNSRRHLASGLVRVLPTLQHMLIARSGAVAQKLSGTEASGRCPHMKTLTESPYADTRTEGLEFMDIFLQFGRNESARHTWRVPSTLSVGALKKRVISRFALVDRDVQVVFAGKSLEDNHTLDDYNIRANAVLYIVVTTTQGNEVTVMFDSISFPFPLTVTGLDDLACYQAPGPLQFATLCASLECTLGIQRGKYFLCCDGLAIDEDIALHTQTLNLVVTEFHAGWVFCDATSELDRLVTHLITCGFELRPTGQLLMERFVVNTQGSEAIHARLLTEIQKLVPGPVALPRVRFAELPRGKGPDRAIDGATELAVYVAVPCSVDIVFMGVPRGTIKTTSDATIAEFAMQIAQHLDAMLAATVESLLPSDLILLVLGYLHAQVDAKLDIFANPRETDGLWLAQLAKTSPLLPSSRVCCENLDVAHVVSRAMWPVNRADAQACVVSAFATNQDLGLREPGYLLDLGLLDCSPFGQAQTRPFEPTVQYCDVRRNDGVRIFE